MNFPKGSNKPAIKVLAILGLILGSLYIATWFPELVFTLITSGLFAFLLRPLVTLFERRIGFKRIISISLVFLLLGGAITIALYLSIPPAMQHGKELYAQMSSIPWERKLSESFAAFSSIPGVDPDSLARQVYQGATEYFSGGDMEQVSALSGYLISLLLVPIIVFFILAEGDTFFKNLIEKVPNKYFEMTLNIIYKTQVDLVGYLRGWLLDSFYVGLLSIVLWYSLGIDYALLLGIITGIANLIPYLGPFIGAVPALIVSILQFGDLRMLGPIAGIVLGIQVIDNVLIQPITFSKNVDMHPLSVIIILIIGNELLGVAGMLVAIPIATILKVTALETYWGLKNYRITW